MKKEYDFTKLKGRRNPYAKALKKGGAPRPKKKIAKKKAYKHAS
jgi:hypothetical protein